MSDDEGEGDEYGRFDYQNEYEEEDREIDDEDIEEGDFDEDNDMLREESEDEHEDLDVISFAAEWRGNEAGKSRVGMSVAIGGIDDLSTIMGGSGVLAKKQQKLNQRDQSSPDITFKTAIYVIQNEYKFSPDIVATVETLIHKIPHIELKNPLAMMLAASILTFDDEKNTTSIDKKKLAALGNEIVHGVKDESKVGKYTILQKAKEKNVTPMDIIRYARFLLPIINNQM